jgi:hypothetical protein
MKNKFILNSLFILVFAVINNQIQAQCNWWAKSFGGKFNDNVTDMKADNNGNVYICGGFSGSLTMGSFTLTSAGDKDIFVAKLNSNGTVLWANQGGGIYEDEANVLTLDNNGNVYVGGKYNTSCTFNNTSVSGGKTFLVSYNANGVINWGKNIKGSDYINDIQIFSNQIFITGKISVNEFENIQNLSYYSTYLASYNLYGNFIKVTTLNHNIIENSKITTDSQGNISLSCAFYGSFILENTTVNSIGNYDLLIVNYSPNLTVNWFETGGGSGSDYAKDVATDINGNIFVLGTFQSSATFSGTTINSPGNEGYFIAKYSNNGNLSWVNSYGSSSGIDSWSAKPSIFVDNTNSIFITGKVYGIYEGFIYNNNTVLTSNNVSGGFILKCNTSGDFQDVKFTNATINEFAVTSNGLMGVGNFEYNTNFSATKLNSNGLSDFFLCKLGALSDLDVSKPNLCMVTLDPTTNKNKIVWEKPTSSQIKGYVIYRRNVLGEYDSIGYQNYANGNFFIDNIGFPDKKSETYSIALIDGCNNLSDRTDRITTMHLMIYPGPNKKWSLLWNEYDDAKYYRVYRGTAPTSKILIDSISADDEIILYTDINSPNETVYYAVEAVVDNNCNTSQGAIAGRVRSNNAFFSSTEASISTLNYFNSSIYPNPSKGNLTIEIDENLVKSSDTKIHMINHLGQVVFSEGLLKTTTDLNLTDFAKGIYFIKIENSNYSSIQKIVIE